MRTRIPCIGAAIRTSCARREHCLVTSVIIAVLAIAVLALPCGLFAQNVAMESAAAPGTDPGAPPVAESGNVNFFSQDLGTLVRLRYNTESYGQDGQGNFDIGSMQVFTMEDTAAIVDGQVTMNDADGVGFNVGVGYRWMNFPFYSASTGRVDGVALWADGTHTKGGNFFPQIGVSYESLGESWDLRSNFYFPIGPQEQIGHPTSSHDVGFQGNSISRLAYVDTSFTVGELEAARRLGAGRDAWAFAGPYFLTNDNEDGAGYRVGMRGYAFPDVLVQFAVSDDEVFKTWATFQVQWFVGRTRSNFQSTCGVPDRLREPFMRNDYVALRKSTKANGIALTKADGSALRVVHVDSSAAAGGNGTFEHPYNTLDQADGANSQTSDIIFAHSTSTFTTGIVLQDNQRLLGEGNSQKFTTVTKEIGTVTIPESEIGARALARPKINGVAGDAVKLASGNEVANFDIDGNNTTVRAIAAPDGGAGNPNLNHLAISNTTGDAIYFKPNSITDPADANKSIVQGNVTIDTVTLDNIAGNGINIDSTSPLNVLLPTVTLQEAIAISNVTSTNGTGTGINIENTHTGTGHTTTLSKYTYDGGTTSAGALRLNNFNSQTFTASDSTLRNGATTGSGVKIVGNSDGTMTFQSNFTLNSLDGTAVDINGDVAGTDSINGSITFQGPIANDTGRSVSVQNIGANAAITFNGNITDTGDGARVNGNSGGTVAFAGNLNMTVDTPGATAVAVTDNTGSTTNFTGTLAINSTSSANGFVATGGGTLSAPGTTNSVSTETGQAVKITGMTVATAGVHFGDVNRTASAATNAIQLETNTNGAITIGNTPDLVGDAGTIVGGTDDAIRITDSANVTITGIRVNNSAAVSGVRIEKSNGNASIVNLNDLELNNGDLGIETIASGAGALTMTVNDTTVANSTVNGMSTSDTGTGRLALLIDHTSVTTGGVDSFALTFGGTTSNSDVIIQNNSNFTAGDARALFVSTTVGANNKLLVQDSHFTNNSGTTATAVLNGSGTSTSFTTVQGNTFTNNGAGDNYAMTSSDTATIDLNLGGTGADMNTATGGNVQYLLTETVGSTFQVFDTTNTFNNTRNNGTVNPQPNAGAFTNLGTAPALPTVP